MPQSPQFPHIFSLFYYYKWNKSAFLALEAPPPLRVSDMIFEQPLTGVVWQENIFLFPSSFDLPCSWSYMDFHPPSRPLPTIKSQIETHLFQSETPWLHNQLLESQSREAENWDSGILFPEQFSETAEQFT